MEHFSTAGKLEGILRPSKSERVWTVLINTEIVISKTNDCSTWQI